MVRLLPLALLALAIVACAQPVPPPAVRVVPGVRTRVEPPALPALLPVLLAAPSTPVLPVESVEAVVRKLSDTDEPEVIELPASRWELPPPLRMRPLSQLSPEAARFLAERGGAVTAGVFVPADNAVYVAGPELAVPMASVAKLVIMVALFERVETEDRPLSLAELALQEPMMVWSDNDSASHLWEGLGGAVGVGASLDAMDVRGIALHPVAWGDSRASGPALAWLLARLAFGDLVSPEHRDLALQLLTRAAEGQSWGVGSGLVRGAAVPSEGTIVGVKDGWYPVEAGWRAGSVGLIMPGPGAPAAVPFSIAVLTAENARLDDGIFTIEGLADRVHAALTPRGAG